MRKLLLITYYYLFFFYIIYCFIFRNEPVINNKTINSRDMPTANLTKSLFKNENTTNNTNKQLNSSLKLPQTKSSSIVFPNSMNEKIQTVPINKFIPEPHVIEKCSLNESFCIKVDNYPRYTPNQINFKKYPKTNLSKIIFYYY